MSMSKKILSLVDLTSLNDNDTNANILKLCQHPEVTNVAAICIYKQFIELVKNTCPKTLVATVINFPIGNANLKDTLTELEYALKYNVDEIDLVMPYQALINGENKFVENFIKKVRNNCSNKTLKIIIESGILNTESLITLASKISINCGANFIKTSTGKTDISATINAATYMLNSIKESNSNCGFKASGGIKTLEQALTYIEVATQIMGESFINPKTFRFGASSLIDNITTTNQQTHNNY